MPRDATRSGSTAMAGADRLDRLLRDTRIRGPVAVGRADAADAFAIGADRTTAFHRSPPCGGPARMLHIQEEMHVWVGPLDLGDRAAERRRLLPVVLRSE